MATEQLHEVSHNIWISTHYKNDQLSIEVRKTPTTAPLCCITSDTGSIGLAFPHGSTRLFWRECLITPEQYTSLDDSENLMLRVKNQDDQKLLSLSHNDKLVAVITAKFTGEFFLSLLTSSTILLPNASLEAVIDTPLDKTPSLILQHNKMPAQENVQPLNDDSVNTQTEANLPSRDSSELENLEVDFCLPTLSLDASDFV